jgi:hypothetical protein
MTVEDEREGANQLQGLDFQGSSVTSENVPQNFKYPRGIQHRATHDQLQIDLVEHLIMEPPKKPIDLYLKLFNFIVI